MDTLRHAAFLCLWLYFIVSTGYQLGRWMKSQNRSPREDLTVFLLFLTAVILTSKWLIPF